MTTTLVLKNEEFVEKIINLLENVVFVIPQTSEKPLKNPEKRVAEIISSSSRKAALISAGLAIPPGPFGIITILPDLYLIWKIQAQMVADIAGVHGKNCNLTKEHMICCLFKQAIASGIKEMSVKCGSKIVVKSLSHSAVKQLLKKIGINISGKSAGKAVSRWLPVIGALGIAVYSYNETKAVGLNALKLFDRPDYDLLEAG
jgi:uncharacterized protein (DUF697 family)